MHCVMNPESQKEFMIRMFNVGKRYPGKVALEDICLDVRAGEFIFITGPSGAGKSTLLKVLYMAETITQGQILIDGMNLARVSRSRLPFLRRRFGMVCQDFRLIPSRTVYDNVALVLEVAGEKPAQIRKKVMQTLKVCGMVDKANAFPPTLSGGEQQRVAVARAVVGEPSVILADEPTGSLDAAAAQKVMDLLTFYHGRGATILMVSHNLDFPDFHVRARNIALNQGRLVSTATIL